MKKLCFLILILVASLSTFGQKKKVPVGQAPTKSLVPVKNDSLTKFKPRSVYLLARNYGDSVVLRWAPREPVYWRAANRSGYVIRRYLVEGKKPSGKQTGMILTPQPIKPWTPETW